MGNMTHNITDWRIKGFSDTDKVTNQFMGILLTDYMKILTRGWRTYIDQSMKERQKEGKMDMHK